MDMEAVYIIQTRESIRMKEPVYKIGRTGQEHTKRSKSYPKGSILKLHKSVIDSRTIETNIKNVFCKKFIQRKDMGIEYFEGNYRDMEVELLLLANEEIVEMEEMEEVKEEIVERGNTYGEQIYIEEEIVKDIDDNYELEDNDEKVNDDIIKIFPNYKKDECFGGKQKLIKICFHKKKLKDIIYYELSCLTIYKKHILQDTFNTLNDFYQSGQIYLVKMIDEKIIENDKIYNLNNKRTIQLFNKYKNKINNVIFDSTLNDEILLNLHNDFQNCTMKYLFSDTLINNLYYVILHNYNDKVLSIYIDYEPHKKFIEIRQI
jgi:hypothetical protein